MRTVVAAVIIRDQQVLVCQRRAQGTHPLKWEFPGGKAEPGESLESALQRELMEELGIQALGLQGLTRYQYTYQEKDPILLVFFQATEFSGQIENRVFERVEWCRRDQLVQYDFLEGDIALVQSLILQS
jgi:8-oxo-dGTP diphosphatase